VKESKYFGIVINESTNVSIIDHMVVFAIFIEGRMPSCVFLGLIERMCGNKTLLSCMRL